MAFFVGVSCREWLPVCRFAIDFPTGFLRVFGFMAMVTPRSSSSGLVITILRSLVSSNNRGRPLSGCWNSRLRTHHHLFRLSSRQTSETASRMLGKGFVPKTMPHTSSRSLLSLIKNLKIGFFSTICLYMVPSLGHSHS